MLTHNENNLLPHKQQPKLLSNISTELIIKIIDMEIKQNSDLKLPSIRTYPIKTSASMTSLIHGDAAFKPSNHLQSLQKLKKDYATIDRQQRQNKINRKKQAYDRRRSEGFERQIKFKQSDAKNLNKMLQRQHRSQQLYQTGTKKTTHSHSIPINPINCDYEKNQPGQKLKLIDEDKHLNQLVRAHKLQTCGNSGYNIINGRNSINIEKLVPSEAHHRFQDKLVQFYSKYKLNPQHP